MSKISQSKAASMQRYTTARDVLDAGAQEFGHAEDVATFKARLAELAVAETAQSQAENVVREKAEDVRAKRQEMRKSFSSIKRLWQGKYGPRTAKGKAIDPPGQNVVPQRQKTPEGEETPTA